MWACHVTSSSTYRNPFGATRVGGTISLSIDVFGCFDVTCTLRTWVDGKGEELLAMEGENLGNRMRFTTQLKPKEPQLIWYFFIIRSASGEEWRYGAQTGRTCGEGVLVQGYDPPSFQITVYRPRKKEPTWYTHGIAYQIFPDRFARGEDWLERAGESLAIKRGGPGRRLIEDWTMPPHYDKDSNGRVTTWDFYGGTLSGIQDKLDYLQSLGVTVIYLNPIFEAASNHRYDTADYMKVDPMLGDEESFSALCKAARERGISIILDGVFNHTGGDSRFFNMYGTYPEVGAWQSPDSPYRNWYCFNEDGTYAHWWDALDLPDLNEENPDYREYVCGKDGVVRHWLHAGARGWRLDVVDELPSDFVEDIRRAELAEKGDAVLIGEVWEDASNKVSYGKQRRYLLGDELDGPMNYPMRRAMLYYLLGYTNAQQAADDIEQLRENYPPEALRSCLNLVGSHDRVRTLTMLGGCPDPEGMTDYERETYHLSSGQRQLAKSRLWLAALLQMTMPGVPCIYYGDEAGVEGCTDPYNRSTYPWDNPDEDCRTIYRNAIGIRRSLPVLVEGDIEPFCYNDDVLGFYRFDEKSCVCVMVNRSVVQSHTIRIPMRDEAVSDIVTGKDVRVEGREAVIDLPPLGSSVLLFHPRQRLHAPMERGMGILCHLTSVPTYDGEPGTLGSPALRFADWLASCEQKYWQMLPVNPCDLHGSPYAGPSAFAGDTKLLSRVKARRPSDAALKKFVDANSEWLLPYATFCALKERFDGAAWQDWPKKWQKWSPKMAQDPSLAEGIERACIGQYEFQRQWDKLHEHCRKLGIKIVGDMPMYVSADSADAWANRKLFSLGEDGWPDLQAGAPPDAFSPAGQMWGNPTYNWDAMRDDGYAWWIARIKRACSLYDYVRLDHFVGFSSYYVIPRGEGATKGAWVPGPGMDLFHALHEACGDLPLIAEDLGLVTPAVRSLLAQCGFPGMDIEQFYDGDARQNYTPAEGKIAYTGTHDNQTLLGFCRSSYGDYGAEDTARWLIEQLLRSRANVAILPLQDVLGLGDEARMNTPGVAGGNWTWQADTDAVEVARDYLRDLAVRFDRR